MEQKPEFFKLDEIDRKVFFWLIDHVQHKCIKSWIEYIEVEYKRKRIFINADQLFKEALELDSTRRIKQKNNVPKL